MEASVVTEMLRNVRDGQGAVLHCCAADIPLGVIAAAGFAPSFDLGLVGDACIETVGTQVDAGGDVLLGIEPATVRRGVAQILDLGSRVGYESRDWLEHVVVTPPCDLLAMPLSHARGTMERLVAVARALREED